MSQREPIRAILACDESGAKGYANQREEFHGEVGVMAGILIHEKIAEETHAAFQGIYKEFKPSTANKLHIADLRPERQEALRKEIYRTIVWLGLPCFWYAIHVEGLFRSHAEHQQLLKEIRPPASPRFKRGSRRENPALLHEELFNGFFGNVMAFMEDNNVEDVAIRIKTDRVDEATVKRFEASAKRFLDDGPLESIRTALDTETGEIVRGSVKTQVDWPDWLRLTANVVDLKVECADDGITLAADILANSLNHLFVNRDPEELYGPLNNAMAVRRHPLAEYFDLFGNPCVGDIVGDRLRAHPKAPKSKSDGLLE